MDANRLQEKTSVPVTAWENSWAILPQGQAFLINGYQVAGSNWAKDWSVWVALTTYLQVSACVHATMQQQAVKGYALLSGVRHLAHSQPVFGWCW